MVRYKKICPWSIQQGVSQKSIQTSELVVGLADKLTNSSSEVWILFSETPCSIFKHETK